jgi:hypothetical protein
MGESTTGGGAGPGWTHEAGYWPTANNGDQTILCRPADNDGNQEPTGSITVASDTPGPASSAPRKAGDRAAGASTPSRSAEQEPEPVATPGESVAEWDGGAHCPWPSLRRGEHCCHR